MAKTSKKNIVVKKSAKKAAASTTTRESNLEYRWLRPMKDEPNPETAFGVVYTTMRKVKRGSLGDVTDAAVKNGFTKYSSQDPTRIVRIALRNFVNDGSVESSRNGVETTAKAKSSKKTAGKKVFKLTKK